MPNRRMPDVKIQYNIALSHPYCYIWPSGLGDSMMGRHWTDREIMLLAFIVVF